MRTVSRDEQLSGWPTSKIQEPDPKDRSESIHEAMLERLESNWEDVLSERRVVFWKPAGQPLEKLSGKDTLFLPKATPEESTSR
jgi:hypothetical protein